MKTWKVRRTRCECEFCGKKNWSPSHMAKHEKSCTMNPNRVCGMCKLVDDYPQPSMEALVEAISVATVVRHEDDYGSSYQIDNQEEALARLREITSCPACILTAIRTLGVPALAFEKFKYREERDEVWSNVNEAAMSRDYGCY